MGAVDISLYMPSELGSRVISRQSVRDAVSANPDIGQQNVGSDEANAVVARLRNRPEIEAAIDVIVEQFVVALFEPDGGSTVVDIQEAVIPVLPVVVAELSAESVAVDEGLLVAALGNASEIEFDTGGITGVAAVVRDAKALVSRVVLVAFVSMILSATAAVALAERRYAMVRTLSSRVLLSALSFAVLFQLGSWALDPERGGTPVASGGSVILGSNGHIFLVIAVIAAATGIAGGWVAWTRQRTRLASPLAESEGSDDDTRELIAV